MKNVYTPLKAAFFILLFALSGPLSTHAQTVTQSWAVLTSSSNANGIAIDASGNVYTSNQSNNTVSKITPAGVVTQSWAALASGATPREIAIDASGNIYTPNAINVSKIRESRVWNGSASTNLTAASNWSPAYVPQPTDSVVLQATTTPYTLGTDATFASLNFKGDCKVILGDKNLTVDTIIGGSSSRYVVADSTGGLTINKVDTTPTLFPMGPSTTAYTPVTITNNVRRPFTLQLVTGPRLRGFGGGISASSIRTVAVAWDITPSVPTGNSATLEFGWAVTSQGSSFNPDVPTYVNHFNSTLSTFDSAWRATTTVDPIRALIKASVARMRFFSPFMVSNDDFTAILPVELVSFSGKHTEGGNLLTWQTASEVNNKGFEIERRIGGSQQATGDSWETVGFVAAKGKSASYTFTDDYRLSPVAYYRLKQVDNDGKFEYSKVISIAQSGKSKGLSLYPNPVSSHLTIENTEGSDFQILNLLGQQVLSGKTPPSGVGGLDVSALPQGTYIFKVGTEQAKFVKQ